MVRVLLFIVILTLPLTARAHVPLVLAPGHVEDAHEITDPGLSQAFYSDLAGFPHSYRISTGEEVIVPVEVLVPDVPRAENRVNVIIVRERERGGVDEVTRLSAANAQWKQIYEPFSAEYYRQGPSERVRLEPGDYRIEVSTPDNTEPYVLVVGEREELGGLGYVETVRQIAQVKEFFGKSPVWVIESPIVYVPALIVVAIIGVGAFIIWRRWYST